MSRIHITKKQNVKWKGKKYIAQPSESCVACAFNEKNACTRAPCIRHHRNDDKEVIFVKKKKAKK